MTDDEMAGWHHRLDGHFEQALGVDDGSLSCWHAAVHGIAKSRTRLSN